MSFWVCLQDKDGKVLVSQNTIEEGGTYVLGGTNHCELNVTYNYSPLFRKYLDKDGLSFLHGKKAKHTVKVLDSAVQFLGTNRSPNYWDAEAGNAGYALSILLGWAKEFPEGIWYVS